MSRLHDNLTGRIKKPEPTLEKQALTFEQMLAVVERNFGKTARKP